MKNLETYINETRIDEVASEALIAITSAVVVESIFSKLFFIYRIRKYTDKDRLKKYVEEYETNKNIIKEILSRHTEDVLDNMILFKLENEKYDVLSKVNFFKKMLLWFDIRNWKESDRSQFFESFNKIQVLYKRLFSELDITIKDIKNMDIKK